MKRFLQSTARLSHERRASTAVEFALIGSLMILFTMGFTMMGVCQFWQMTLDDAVRGATRQLLLSSSSTTPETQTQFINSVCSEFGVVAPCSSNNLQVEVQTNTSTQTFAGITPAIVSQQGQLSPKSGFPTIPTSGGPYPTLIQVAYQLPPWMDFLPYLPLSGATIPSLNVLLTGNATAALVSNQAVMVN